MDEGLKQGDTVRLRFGPFLATGRVRELTPVGAVVSINDDATLVGFENETITSPNGVALTPDSMHTFIGRAHWHSTEVIR